jgi:hypothetical protein
MTIAVTLLASSQYQKGGQTNYIKHWQHGTKKHKDKTTPRHLGEIKS